MERVDKIDKSFQFFFGAGSDLSKPVARHFNLPGHSHEHMEICGIYLHLGNNETRKRKEQRLIFKLGTLAPNGINERFSFA